MTDFQSATSGWSSKEYILQGGDAETIEKVNSDRDEKPKGGKLRCSLFSLPERTDRPQCKRKMKNTKRRVELLVVGVVLLTLLLGITQIAVPQEKVELTFWTMQTQPYEIELFKRQFAQFEAETGTRVNIQIIPWADAWSKFVAGIAAGILPDVSQTGTTWDVSFYGMGEVLLLDDLVAELGVDTFIAGRLKTTRYEDHYTGVPWFTDPRVLFYRADWFEESGLASPTNWNELLVAAQKLTDPTSDRLGLALPYKREMFTGQTWFSWLMNNGGSFVTRDKTTGEVRPNVTTPEAIEALQNYTDYFTKYNVLPVGSGSYGSAESWTSVMVGKVAMTIGNGWFLKDVEERAPELLEENRIGAVLIPGQGGRHFSFVGGPTLFVPAKTKHPQEAKELIKFMLREDINSEFLRIAAGYPSPALTYFADDPWFAEDPLTSVLHKQAGIGDFTGMHGVDGAWPACGVAEGSMLWVEPVLDVCFGGMSVEEALAKNQRKIQEAIDETAGG